jgi:hypothetical protein
MSRLSFDCKLVEGEITIGTGFLSSSTSTAKVKETVADIPSKTSDGKVRTYVLPWWRGGLGVIKSCEPCMKT